MFDSLRKWRRIVGGLVLILACITAVGWVRGFLILDMVDLGSREGYLRIQSSCCGLMLFRNLGDPTRKYGDSFEWHSHRLGAADGPQNSVAFYLGEDWQRELLWHRSWAGFHTGKCIWRSDLRVMTMTVIPYWSIVGPLVLLSGWLLLLKPGDRRAHDPSGFRELTRT